MGRKTVSMTRGASLAIDVVAAKRMPKKSRKANSLGKGKPS